MQDWNYELRISPFTPLSPCEIFFYIGVCFYTEESEGAEGSFKTPSPLLKNSPPFEGGVARSAGVVNKKTPSPFGHSPLAGGEL